MADPISASGSMPQPNLPAPVDGQGAPAPDVPNPALNTTMPGTSAPAPTSSSQQINPAQQPQKPGNFFTNLSHAFMGAILGGLAGSKEDVAQYHTDPETGQLTPLYKDPDTGQLTTQRKDMHPREQLAKIAHSALRGLAYTAMAGPAGPAMAAEQPKVQDARLRSQAQTEFENTQKATFNRVNNAHLLLQNVELTKNLATSDLATNQRSAAIGNDMMEAAVEGGNKVVGNANMNAQDLSQFRQDHPEYLDYTPMVTQATLATNPDGTPAVDPKTGIQKVNLGYTMVDMKSPIKLTDTMINHLQTMNIPGADKLTAGQKVNPTQFQALYFNGLQAYNEANRDAKNNEVVDTADKDGNLTKTMINKVTKEVTPLVDPTTKQPLNSKVETEIHTIFDPATNKNEDWLLTKNNGRKITFLGENKTDMSSITNAIGDFSKTGEAYLATIPIQLRGTVKSLADYGMKPADLGRSNSRLALLEAAGQYNGAPLDLKTYQLRFDYMNGYQDPKSGDGKQRAAGNTAIGHLDSLSQAGELLAQNNLVALNAIANNMGLATGNSAQAIYDTIAYKAAAEASTAAVGGVPNEGEINKLYEQLRASASPQQRIGAINAQYGLLVTPLENMRIRFTEAMGKTPEAMGRPIVNAQNEKILQKHGYGRSPIAGGTAEAAPAGPAGGVPTPLTNLHSDGKITIGWDGKNWVDSTTRQPITQGAK